MESKKLESIRKDYTEAIEQYSIDSPKSFRNSMYTTLCHSEYLSKLMKELKHNIGITDPTILDLGCGLSFLLKLNDINPDNYTGYDIMSEFIEVSKNKYPKHAHKFICGDFFEEDMKSSYDIVVINDVFNYYKLEEILAKVDDLMDNNVKCALTFTVVTDLDYDDEFYKEVDPSKIMKHLKARGYLFRIDVTSLQNRVRFTIYKTIACTTDNQEIVMNYEE